MIVCDGGFENNNTKTGTDYLRSLGFPTSATFELTPFCNFSCKMCYVRLTEEQAKKQGRQLSKDEWLDIARQARDMGVLFLSLTGGEPLTRPDFWDIYGELNKMGFLISIMSNGSMINEEAIERFREYGMPYSVKLTLYGASDDTYKRLCGCDDGFARIEKAVRLLKEEKVPLTLTGTMVRENAEDLAEMYNVAEAWGVPFQHTISVVKSARGSTSPVEASRFDFGEFSSKMTLGQIEKNKMPQHTSPFGWCRNYKTSFWMTWNGRMQMCAFMNGPYADDITDLKHSWSDLNIKLDGIKNPEECNDCKYSEFCQRCPGLLCGESGSPERTTPSVCNTAKQLYESYIERMEEGY